jgi:hypothetical protein
MSICANTTVAGKNYIQASVLELTNVILTATLGLDFSV